MVKKIVFLFFFITSVFFLKPQFIYGQSAEELNNKIAEYTQKLNELNKAKDTLSNQIKLLDSQYQLTLLKITQTESSIKTLEKEIANLDVEIGKLEVQINQLSVAYIHQTVQNYKLQKRIPAFAFLFSSNLNTFLEQQRYMTSVQKNSQTNLLDMETVRANYDIQKTAKEKKQIDLEALQKTLASQKISLNNQKISKNKLLEATKNDENKYQQMLNDALSQLSAFGTFTSGGSLLSNQTHCDSWGCYYNQRDSEWGNIVFGYSDGKNGRVYYDMKGYGCLITSTTMILNHYGKSLKPSDLAKDSSLFDGHTGNMSRGNLSTNGVNFNRSVIGYSLSSADSELNAGRPVIAGVNGSSSFPAHFIVIKAKKDGKYIVNDPYIENGHDINLPSQYTVKRIDSIKLN